MTTLSVNQMALPARLWLARGKQALQAGKRDEAVAAFRRAVTADPEHSDSWLWLAGFCEDPHESLRCLARVLDLDPHSEAAHEGIRWARKRLATRDKPHTPAPPAEAAAQVASAAPHVDAAQVALAPPSHHKSPTTNHKSDPAAAEVATAAPPAEAAAQVASAAPHVDAAQVATAAPSVDAAAERATDAPNNHKSQITNHKSDGAAGSAHVVRAAVVLLLLFIVLGGGSGSFWESPLPVAAASADETALDLSVSGPLADLVSTSMTPSFLPVPSLAPMDLRYQQDYEKGLELRQQNDLQGALKAFQSAVALDPNAIEARSELAQLKADLDTQSGSPNADSAAALAASGVKWIDVNLTTQHFRAMHGKAVVYSWPASTGVPGSATVPGHFRILDKIPNAYSYMWKLKMPYWMGIYWAGKAENGIHALPINRKGKTIWGNLLGQRSSFGCVILDTRSARTLFNWANVGTQIIIHY